MKKTFTKRFIEDVRKSEAAHHRGDYVRCSSRKERDKLFDSL
jgi:hypothetical protein